MRGEHSPGSACHGYIFDNAAEHADTRLRLLSEIFDPGTIRHLSERGVGQGWHCLEVGGGNGSIASWLSQRVGAAGKVLVTDIDPRFLEPMKMPNVEVRHHNIVSDGLAENAFDLVHSRLVLLHLPEREKALRRMISALKPGGWLVDEEFDSTSMLADPSVSPGEASLKTHAAMIRLLNKRTASRRVDCRWFHHGKRGRARSCSPGRNGLLDAVTDHVGSVGSPSVEVIDLSSRADSCSGRMTGYTETNSLGCITAFRNDNKG